MSNCHSKPCNFSNIETDIFEHCFTLPCGTRTILWETGDGLKTCGSFTIEILQACDRVTIFVNGQPVITKPQLSASAPQQGDLTYSYTSGNLQSIEVLCQDPTVIGGTCKIKLCLTTHYECC